MVRKPPLHLIEPRRRHLGRSSKNFVTVACEGTISCILVLLACGCRQLSDLPVDRLTQRNGVVAPLSHHTLAHTHGQYGLAAEAQPFIRVACAARAHSCELAGQRAEPIPRPRLCIHSPARRIISRLDVEELRDELRRRA
eukprot:7090950-Prymnesium_polylepis.1